MNTTIYLFGELGQGYSQYPIDYTQEIFQECYARSKEKSQLATHRKGELMYYVYTRKLDKTILKTQYIGICIVTNGIVFTNFTALFSIFENVFASLAINGEIIGLTDKGNIVSRTIRLNEKLDEIEKISRFAQGEISQLNSTSKKLPPTSYGIANNEIKTYSITDNPIEIAESIYKYSYTFISKDQNYDTHSLLNYRSIIQQLNQEKKDITKKFNELTTQYQRVLNQKRQIKWVTFLLVSIVMGIVIFLNIRDEMQNKILNLGNDVTFLNKTKDNLEAQINKQKQELSDNSIKINILQTKLNTITQAKNEAEVKITNQENIIARLEETLSEKELKIRELHKYQSYSQILSTSNTNDIYITNPTVSSSSGINPELKIKSIQITYAQTIIELEYERKTNDIIWINISPKTYIVSYNTGKKYNLAKVEGIPYAPQKLYLSQTRTRFKLIFPTLPQNTTQFNLIEEEGNWKFYGIKLK